MAEANYVLMAPHIWGGPIITAAAVQIDANIPNFLIQESIYKSRSFFDEIVVDPFEWDNGDLIQSERPGDGIELDEEKLEAHRGSLETFDANADDERDTRRCADYRCGCVGIGVCLEYGRYAHAYLLGAGRLGESRGLPQSRQKTGSRIRSNSPNQRANPADYPINCDDSPAAIANYNGVGSGTAVVAGHFPRFHPSDFRVRQQ